MSSWKGKVTGKLSRLFSDSPSSASPDQTQTRIYSKEAKPSSSIFSFIMPSLSLGGLSSNKSQHDAKSIQSHLIRWKSRGSSRRGKPLDIYTDNGYSYETKEASNGHEDEEKRDDEPGRSISCSEIFEDAADSQSSENTMFNLTDHSLFISPNLYEFFQSSLPNIVKGCQWVLLYSTARHGISLRTLIRKSGTLSGPCLLITGDKQGAVFGGLLECPLRPTPKRKYQGTNQAFVFTTIYGEPRLFRATGANRYFYMCLNDLLALGGGGNFALCLDGDLLSGTSGPCETFGNLCLANGHDFEVKNVELWGFAHTSQYPT